jgi:hypothetical protein
MDFTNFIYPLGLAFMGVIFVLQLLHLAYELAARWYNVEDFDVRRMAPITRYAVPAFLVVMMIIQYSGYGNALYNFCGLVVTMLVYTVLIAVIAFVT